MYKVYKVYIILPTYSFQFVIIIIIIIIIIYSKVIDNSRQFYA